LSVVFESFILTVQDIQKDILKITEEEMSTKKIGEFSEGHLLKRAAEIVAEKTHGSKVLDAAAEARIPKFDNSGTFFGVHCKCIAIASLGPIDRRPCGRRLGRTETR
jgi:hypothetical protein